VYVYPPPPELEVSLRSSNAHFRLEKELLDGLRLRSRSKHIKSHLTFTLNASSANLFWIPHALAVHLFDPFFDDRFNKTAARDELGRYYHEALRPFLSHIYHDLPYFNESCGGGHGQKQCNHLFVYSLDNGPVCEMNSHSPVSVFANDPLFQAVVHPSIIVGYFGQKTSVLDLIENKRYYNGIVPPADRMSEWRRNCYEDGWDITVPQWDDGSKWNKRDLKLIDAVEKCEHAISLSGSVDSDTNTSSADGRISGPCRPWLEILHRRAFNVTKPFFFRGQVSPGRWCSPGIRPWLEKYCKKTSNCNFNNNARDGNKAEQQSMDSAVYAFCPAGYACWSSRYYDALDKMAVPVRLADDIVDPFSDNIDYALIEERVETHRYNRGNSTGIGGKANIREVALPPDGGKAIRDMVRGAYEWMTACGMTGIRSRTFEMTEKDIACVRHPISHKLGFIVRTRHKLSWDIDEEEGAFALLELDIASRVLVQKGGGKIDQ